MDAPTSPVGFHCLSLPDWVSAPPIEAVVFAWGASEDHQLGLDTEDNIDNPKVVESLLGLKFAGRSFRSCPLVGGSRNTLAIDADGGLWSWGWNARGTLGHGHRELQRKPACVPGLAGVHIVQAAIGGWHCLALSDEGHVYAWGGNEYQQCGLVAPEPGAQHQQPSALQGAGDTASTTGTGQGGMLIAAATAVGKASGLTGVAVGHDDTPRGTAAGMDPHLRPCSGQLLHPPERDILVPRRCMPGLVVRQVACGGMNSVVLTDSGEVWTWGEPWGEFALELQRAPRKVPGAECVSSIACGAFHNMALVADGRVLCWGTNDYGQLGNGSTIYSTTPVEVVDLEDVAVADIAAGGWHSMALSADGEIYVWGRGEYGRLGIADRTGSSKLRPQKVRGLEGHTVAQVAAGGTHSLAVTSAGRMFIWGRGSYGRLGLGAGAKDAYAPVEAALPGGHERWRIAAATAGGRHTMCLAVPVRDAVQRGRETDGGSRAGSIIGRSVPPSRAASVQGELTVVASHSGLPTGPQGTARPSSPVDTLAASAPAHMAGGGGHAPSDPATASTASSNGAGTATPAVGGRTSLAISPRVSVLGGSLAGSSYADAATAFLPGGNRSDTPQGVEFVHAATAAAASAWHLGELRVGSPAPPSAVLASSGSGGRPPRPLAQQAPLSPRSMVAQLTPSCQQRAVFDTASALLARTECEDVADDDDGTLLQAQHQAVLRQQLAEELLDEAADAAADEGQVEESQQLGSASSSSRGNTALAGLPQHVQTQQQRPAASAPIMSPLSPPRRVVAVPRPPSPALGGVVAAAPPPLGAMSRQESLRLQAAVVGSYGRVDAARQASASSLPTISGHRAPPVTRIDSDISQDGLVGLACGSSPAGSVSAGPGGPGSPAGSTSGGSASGLGEALGTSPPGVYDVTLGGGVLARQRDMHMNSHLS